MTNYAKWFTYYRTRVLAAKTTSAIAFNIVDKTYRAGFQSMNLRTAAGRPPRGSTSTTSRPRTDAWYSALFGISIGPAMTPTIDAMIRIGEVVRQGAGAVTGLPAHTDPLPTVAGNVVSCTNNYHILFTDGETNQADAAHGRRRGGRDGHSRRASSTARAARYPARSNPSDGRVVRQRHRVAEAVP